MNIGVLGLGFMGSTHLQALARIPGARVTAVMSRNEKRLAGDFSDIQGNLGGQGQIINLNGARKYRSVRELIEDPEVDAVDICLPSGLHAPAAVDALRAGKHVLVEKPMALDGADADAVAAEAAMRGRVLMVAHVCRFFSEYRELAALVRSGRLGPIRSALFRRRTAVPTWGPWEFDKSQSGGGVFDLLIHDVDQALHLFGTPTHISSTGHEDMAGGIDQIVSWFHYPDVASVTITGGWHHAGEYPFSMEYTVTGDRGVVEFSSAGRPATVYWVDGRAEPLPPNSIDPFQAEIGYFLDCCRNNRQPALCQPSESAAAVKLARLMVDAREKKGEKLTCNL
jgi:predicted dehydrogenase